MWKFDPILKETIWGGDKILSLKGLDVKLDRIGESWEASGVEGMESKVSCGPDKGLTLTRLVHKYGPELLGERNYKKYGDRFPLLVKILDAHEDLSVQVHPDDALAQKRGFDNGKTEMWYVLEADKGARIANGFNRKVDPAQYDSLVESGKIEDALNYMEVKPGDVYFMPAGRVHTAGKGCMMIEIQQTSDVTYRIYDYHRKDKEGRERELHTDLAREAINFNDTEGHAVDYALRPNVPVNVILSPFFSVNLLEADTDILRDYSESDTFVILVVAEGQAEIVCGKERFDVKAGTSVLIPATALGITINPHKKAKILETYIK